MSTGGSMGNGACQRELNAEIVPCAFSEPAYNRPPESIFLIFVFRSFCRQFLRRVQGRHQLQTSDAVGVGSVQVGPEALTLAAILNKQMGCRWGTRDKSYYPGIKLHDARIIG